LKNSTFPDLIGKVVHLLFIIIRIVIVRFVFVWWEREV